MRFFFMYTIVGIFPKKIRIFNGITFLMKSFQNDREREFNCKQVSECGEKLIEDTKSRILGL